MLFNVLLGAGWVACLASIVATAIGALITGGVMMVLAILIFVALLGQVLIECGKPDHA